MLEPGSRAPCPHLTWVRSRFCSFSIRMVCCCQLGAEGEVGARLVPCEEGVVSARPLWDTVLETRAPGGMGHSPCQHRL